MSSNNHARVVSLLVPGLLFLGAGCAQTDSEGSRAASAGSATPVPVDTLVTTASGLVGNPTDLEVETDGTLYVLDGMSALVHRIGPAGEHLGSFGGEGAGPTELSRPRTIARGRADTLWVVDGGNGRLQAYAPEGAHLGSWSLHPFASSYPSHVGRDGDVAVSSLGRDSARVAVYGRDGQRRARLGTPVFVQAPGMIRISELKEEVAAGGVPELFRNTSWPFVTASGDVWLSTPADGVLERFAPDGTSLDSIAVDDPTFPTIEEHFRARNADPEYRGLYALMYVVDLYAAGGDLYLLLNPAGDGPAVVHRYGADGTRTGRWGIETVRGPINLAVDPERGRLYFGIADTAEVLAVDLAAL